MKTTLYFDRATNKVASSKDFNITRNSIEVKMGRFICLGKFNKSQSFPFYENGFLWRTLRGKKTLFNPI